MVGGAKPEDFVVLGGESCERPGSEVGELIDCRVRLRQAGLELVDVCFEPFDLRCLRVRGLASVL
jgi:hypothetical protein